MPGKGYLKWFKKADEDELSIKAILKGEGSPSTAAFLSQQMAEKYLKGLLVFYQKSYIKVHDLISLETLLLDGNKEINQLHDQLQKLNRYYIEKRYPGDYTEISLQEAEEAYQAAKEVKSFVLDVVPVDSIIDVD